jgi:Antitoxin VbhA
MTDRDDREKAAKNAIAITAMEGGKPSAHCQELIDLWVAGEISGEEMRSRMRLRKRKPDAGIAE